MFVFRAASPLFGNCRRQVIRGYDGVSEAPVDCSEPTCRKPMPFDGA
jgi:hypothetical protein